MKKKHIVIIVDLDDKTYWSHHDFSTFEEARAFSKGMKAAWDISHGPANCWEPYVLDDPYDLEEWQKMGSPGKEKFALTNKQ